MKTTEYIDAVKAKLSLSSDYAFAKVVGITTQAVANYRAGRSPFGVETAMKVGEILGVDGHAVYAQGQIERAKNAVTRDFWQGISEKFSASFKRLLSEKARVVTG